MRRVKPEVYLIAETQVDQSEIKRYLNDIGANDWKTDEGISGSEFLTEFMGRQCYRSFGAGLNANVTKVREGNSTYLGNILKVGHGSVCEHAVVSFIFHNVSRVFTHELVRHRAGCAMSQESLRYIRLTDLGLWLPDDVAESNPKIVDVFEKLFTDLEQLQLELADALGLDEEGVDFTYKKKMTSFMRRAAPIGLSTSIGFSMNHRALRHILAMRTSRHAETEIRLVFAKVGEICMERWPNLYSDFKIEIVDGLPEFSTENNKI